MQKLFLFIVLLFNLVLASAQDMSAQQYIDAYKDIAISEMLRSGVPASITLAQGLLETENGNSDLVKKSNNHFGIKCKSSWDGERVYHDDDASGECFRKYNTAEESYKDHSDFLKGRSHYAFLFKLDPTNYKGWAYGLKKAGYATNPRYPQMLIKSIEDFNLNQYSLAALTKMDSGQLSAQEKANVDSSAALSNTKSINGVKAVFALKGTSLLAIAIKNNISLASLLEYNGLKNDGMLDQDGWILLEDKKNKLLVDRFFPNRHAKNNAHIHEVKPKEGLYSISKKYSVSVKDLKEWNNLQSDDLQVGQKLIISK